MRWIVIATLAVGWNAAPARAALDDDIVEYGRRCAAELGTEVPDLYCLDTPSPLIGVPNATEVKIFAGEPEGPATEITNDTAPPRDKCNKPVQLPLGSAPDGQCVPHARLIKVVKDIGPGEQVITQAFCRRYKFLPRDTDEFHDVNIIQFNTKTRRACFFNTNPGDPRSGRPIQPPFRAGWTTDAEKKPARDYWLEPSEIANQKCLRCHDSDLWIHTPYVDQVPDANKVTLDAGAVPTPVANAVGEPFRLTKFPVPARMGFHQDYFDMAFPLTEAVKADLRKKPEAERQIASPSRCSHCHRIGADNTCNFLAPISIAALRDALSPPFDKWPKNHWMPTKGRSSLEPTPTAYGATDDATFNKIYAQAILAMKECCADPDLAKTFPGVNNGVAVPLCKDHDETAAGKAAFTLTVKGNASLVTVSAEPDSEFYADYGFEVRYLPDTAGFTCPLDGDPSVEIDTPEFKQTVARKADGTIESITCIEKTSSRVRRYGITTTACPGATFDKFDGACTGAPGTPGTIAGGLTAPEKCTVAIWNDTVLDAVFSGKCKPTPTPTATATPTPHATTGPSCPFDTDDDGVDDFFVPDSDGDGICEFPTSKTHVHGALTFGAGQIIEFRGATVLEADTITIEEGAILASDPSTVSSLKIIALRGDFDSRGVLALGVSDDLVLGAEGSLILAGDTHLVAGDRVRLTAEEGDVVVTPATFEADGPFTVLGANRVEIRARGADGSIEIERARVGSGRIGVITKASVSEIGEKHVRIADQSVLTTDPGRTGLPSGGKLDVDATGRVSVADGAQLDASYRLTIRTRRPGDDLCLAGGVTLEAQRPDRLEKIKLTGVAGQVFDDGATAFVGTLYTNGVVPGTCP